MISSDGSNRPGAIRMDDASRSLQKLFAVVAKEADLAPWHDVWVPDSEIDPVTFIRQQKLYARTKRTLLSSLLLGELRAHYSDGCDSCDVPGWAWQDAETDDDVWFAGRLRLSVFLPEPWHEWSGNHVFLEREAFDRWSEAQVGADISAHLVLPTPCDATHEPSPVSARPPPDVPFVTLSEALSWIAFHFALDNFELDRALGAGAFGPPAYQQKKLARAVAEFASIASGGGLSVRGKYVEGHLVDCATIETNKIEPVRFEDYAQFDIVEDGLRRGTGLTFCGDEGELN